MSALGSRRASPAVRLLRLERRLRSGVPRRCARARRGDGSARASAWCTAAGSVGLMGVVADAALAGGGEVIGRDHRAARRRPRWRTVACRRWRSCPTCTSARRGSSSWPTASSCCPAGFGTVDEVDRDAHLEPARPGAQAGRAARRRAASGAPLFDWMDAAVASGFVRSSHRMLAQRAHTVDEALALATGAGARDARTSGSTATPVRSPSPRVPLAPALTGARVSRVSSGAGDVGRAPLDHIGRSRHLARRHRAVVACRRRADGDGRGRAPRGARSGRPAGRTRRRAASTRRRR